MPPLKAPQFDDPQVTEMKVAHVGQPEDRHITRTPRNLPFLMDGDFLRVVNDDKKTWDFVWEQRHWPVEPGQEVHVLFEALVDVLGDPRSVDGMLVKYQDASGNKGLVMPRYSEIQRLCARYAIENENIDDLVMASPKLRVYTNQGQAVTFPIQNPDMMAWPTPDVNPMRVNSDTSRMIDQVAAENAELRENQRILEDRIDRILATREGVDALPE